MSVLSQGPFSHNRFDDYEKLHEKNSKPDFLDLDKDGNKKESMKKASKDKDCDCKEKPCDCDDKKSKKESFLDMIKNKKKGVKEEVVNENRFAAHGGKDTDAGAKYAKPSKGGNKKGVYTIKGKDGKPLFGEETVAEGSCGGSKAKKKVVKEDVLEYILENNLANNPVSAEALFNHISDEFLEQIEDQIMEGFKSLPIAKMANQANKAYGKEQSAVKSGDEAGANKQMQRRIAMTNPAGRRQQLAK